MSTFQSATSVIELLRAKKQSVAVAESLTGGGVGAALTSVPGASDVFLGGVIAYSPAVKESLLAVERETIADFGVVSEEVAVAMADGVRELLGSTWGISTTGVAGPGDAEGVAAGTVWIAISGPINQSTQLEVEGEREVVRNASVSSAISTFERILVSLKA
ncbi:MAG: CinA family protein [Candidatus Nanopelagicaceae bacterium]|nr:CinA family protein [Candidatus Nanopelagicaceae bacterium]